MNRNRTQTTQFQVNRSSTDTRDCFFLRSNCWLPVWLSLRLLVDELWCLRCLSRCVEPIARCSAVPYTLVLVVIRVSRYNFMILVTGNCCGVVSYNASHATATMYWYTVLRVWVPIISDSSTRDPCCGCSRHLVAKWRKTWWECPRI
jgi:hypothetical protein